MTTNNINKIVRNNINIKPWILSKNTSEIVNTYIQKLYKRTPSSSKGSDLLQPKTIAPKLENKGPLRSLKLRERPRMLSSTNAGIRPRVSNANGEQLLNAIMSSSKRTGNSNLAANKKFLKSPNYKIYGSRRFGSSASSSSASIFRHYDEKRRQRTPLLTQTLPSSTSHGIGAHRNFGFSLAAAKYLVPVRNQHMENYKQMQPYTMQVSTAIQRDLMVIDNVIKNRIALGRNQLNKIFKETKKHIDPLDGWHHPPSAELLLFRSKEADVVNMELLEQTRLQKIASKHKHTSYLRQIENTAPLAKGNMDSKASNQRMSDTYQSIAREPQTRVQPLTMQQCGNKLNMPSSQRLQRQQHEQQQQKSMTPEKQQSLPSQPQLLAQTYAHGRNQTRPATPRFCMSALSKPQQQQQQQHSPLQPAQPAQMASETAVEVMPKKNVPPPPPPPQSASPKLSAPPITATATSVIAAAVANESAPYNFSRFNRSSYTRARRY